MIEEGDKPIDKTAALVTGREWKENRKAKLEKVESDGLAYSCEKEALIAANPNKWHSFESALDYAKRRLRMLGVNPQ
jgi:hypothetical protein